MDGVAFRAGSGFAAGVPPLNAPARNAWLLVLAWLGLILVGSGDGLSAPNTSRFLQPLLHWLFPMLSPKGLWQGIVAIRKGGHLTEFAILALLARHAWVRTLNGRAALAGLSPAALAFTFAVLCAAGDEWRQSFVPSREGSLRDVLIDAVGAALGLWVVGAILKWRRRSHPPATSEPGAT